MKSFRFFLHLVLALLVGGQLLSASGQVPRFLNPVSYPVPGASKVVLADVNGDGILDIVTANGYSFTGSGVSLLLGAANGRFQAAKTIVAAGNPSWIVVADFNNDGKLDLAVGNEPDPNLPPPVGGPDVNSVSLLLGNGDGTFRPSIDTQTAGARFMAAADFNGDGKLDLAITGTDSLDQILLGNGDGTFSVKTTSVNGFTGNIIAGDFNHDGKQDILSGGWEMLGNGDGTFTLGESLPVSGLQVLADFDGDGHPDLAGLFGTFHEIVAEVAMGLPDGTWNASFISDFSSSSNLVAADFDGDGKQDLFGAGAPAPGPLNQAIGGLFLGNGDGMFTLAAVGFGSTLDSKDGEFYPSFAAAGDLDHNGSPDVVIAVGTGVLVALNTAGNPPLLAQISTSQTFVVGGTSPVTGTVSLGGPAPRGGALVTLASSNPAVTFPNGKTVLIAAGSQSANFSVATSPVTKAVAVTISGAYGAVKQNTKLAVLPPFTISSVSINPSSLIGLYGGAAATGTVTLTGPASDGTVVALSSSVPNIAQIPATVSFVPGATSATFPVAAFNVASDTAVTISGTLQGTQKNGTLTIRKETATVAVTKAEYTVKKSQLKVEATSNDRVATLQVFNSVTGQLLGSIPLVGVGKYSGQLTVTGPLNTIAVQSSVGGLGVATVTQK